jgi:hypothetical protein
LLNTVPILAGWGPVGNRDNPTIEGGAGYFLLGLTRRGVREILALRLKAAPLAGENVPGRLVSVDTIANRQNQEFSCRR